LVDARIDARVYQWFDERIDTIISARIAARMGPSQRA